MSLFPLHLFVFFKMCLCRENQLVINDLPRCCFDAVHKSKPLYLGLCFELFGDALGKFHLFYKRENIYDACSSISER